MGSDMVRTTMEPCTAHCFIACEPVGAKNFALDSGWTTSGTPQKHVDNKIGRILPVQKFGQLDRIGHWTMATAQGRLHIFLLILATFTASFCQTRLCPKWARQPACRPKAKSLASNIALANQSGTLRKKTWKLHPICFSCHELPLQVYENPHMTANKWHHKGR